MNAALNTLVDEGIDQVKVMVLAKKLNVSRASFYWYFSDKEALHTELINHWSVMNTQVIIRQATAPAPSIIEAVANIFSCWMDETSFSPRLDAAMRAWAHQDKQIKELVDREDEKRLTSIKSMYLNHGYEDEEAFIRARVLYFMQIGYYALGIQESFDTRLSYFEPYVYSFTGLRPTEAQVRSATRIINSSVFKQVKHRPLKFAQETDMTGRVKSRRGRIRNRQSKPGADRQKNYRLLKNPFRPQKVFSDDEINAIHQTALRVLEELGIKVLLEEARHRFRKAGAVVDHETQMVNIGRDIVSEALETAPKSIPVRTGNRERDFTLELGALLFGAGAGSPNVMDKSRGRRAGTLRDFDDFIRLTQSFDALHFLVPFVEPQDVATHLRHYATIRSQVLLSDKFPFLFSRGSLQVEQTFELLQIARSVSAEEFNRRVYCFTIINSNSPRQLDIPMAQGIIDFARYGQVSIITPFCLAGAMAPITVAGALTLQHAEALAGITLAQLTRPGSPVMYGSFSSNVDMKSGSPAFGTPEHVKATLGSGQLARLIGLPWRAGAGSASNTCDAQGAHENQMGLWGAVLAGATTIVHSAGWQEGGLSTSFDKFITDMETVQSIAELCSTESATADNIGFEAIRDVAPGGHFFSTRHTMQRYKTAFYEPIVADLSNYGTWKESGEKTAELRAADVWKQKLNDFVAPEIDAAIVEELDAYIEIKTRAGGAPPVS